MLHASSDPCPRCALIDVEVASAINGKRTAADVERWLKGQQPEAKPHPLEAEIGRLAGDARGCGRKRVVMVGR